MFFFMFCEIKNLFCFTCIFHTCVYVFVECFRHFKFEWAICNFEHFIFVMCFVTDYERGSLLGSKTLRTKCIRTSLCIMLANHDQNIESRFRLAQSVFICKSWNRVIVGFIGLNLQNSIDRKLDSIDRTSCRLIFLQNFPTQPKPV